MAIGRLARRCSLLRVASHNIMDGIHMKELAAQYARMGIDLLCMQEAVPGAAEAAAEALGGGGGQGGRRRNFAVAASDREPRMAILYDRTKLRLCELDALTLPALEQLPLWQRAYTKLERKRALVGRFQLWPTNPKRCRRDVDELFVANFHLDAGGDNAHRTAQLEAVASALAERTLASSSSSSSASSPLPSWLSLRRRRRAVVACGDTNAFDFDPAVAERDLDEMLAPLRWRVGASDVHAAAPEPTHYFARADEPKIGQRIAVALGRLGVDFPRRYDVIAASSRAVAAGCIETPKSDHDLVWADLSMRAS